MYSDTERQKEKMNRTIISRIFRRRTKRLLTDTEMEFQKYLDTFLIYYIVLMICGILFAVIQSFTVFHCSKILGVLFMLGGMIHFYFFRHRHIFSMYRFSVFFGLSSIILGLCLILIKSVTMLFVVTGIVMLVLTVERMIESFVMFRLHDGSFPVLITNTILSIGLSILFMINPFQQLQYTEVFGIFSILFSILNLSGQSILQRRISEFVGCFD